jgi:hypothetical protein
VTSLPSHEILDDRTVIASRPRLGMCSVTMRDHDAAAVIDSVSRAGLESIEWGSDVHVPAGDVEVARRIGDATREAGLEVCSYGSYVGFPWQRGAPEKFRDVLASARALGAPRVRIWAGPEASADASVDARAQATADIRAITRAAEQEDIEVALEFHLGTLTDTAESTLELLRDLGFAASTYWQPRVGVGDEDALGDLDALSPYISTIHAFSWGSRFDRHLLDSRESLWRAVLDRAVALPRVTDVLIEFLPQDDIALLVGEARALRDWAESAAGDASS